MLTGERSGLVRSAGLGLLDGSAPFARQRLVGVLDPPFHVAPEVSRALPVADYPGVGVPELVVGAESPDVAAVCSHKTRVRVWLFLWQPGGAAGVRHGYNSSYRCSHALGRGCGMSEPRRYLYRHIWPIEDLDRPISALRVEATAALEGILTGIKATQVDEPRWSVAGDRLLCEVPVKLAQDATGDATPSGELDEAAVLRLVRLRWTDTRIASELGIPRWVVARIRREAGYPPVAKFGGDRKAAA